MPVATAQQFKLEIPPIIQKQLTVQIVGDSPLVVHRWTEKAKKEMLDKHMLKATSKKRAPKNPVEDFIESMYWLSGKPAEYSMAAFDQAILNGARFGFPARAFKAAAVSAGYRAGFTKNMVSTQGMFHIQSEMVEIIGTPIMREDMVTINMGLPDIRYRGMFEQWQAEFSVSYDPSLISAEQLVNLINRGGFNCGVGENRVEKGGTWGRYHVAVE